MSLAKVRFFILLCKFFTNFLLSATNFYGFCYLHITKKVSTLTRKYLHSIINVTVLIKKSKQKYYSVLYIRSPNLVITILATELYLSNKLSESTLPFTTHSPTEIINATHATITLTSRYIIYAIQ